MYERSIRNPEDKLPKRLIILCFLLGSVVGSAVGTFSSLGDMQGIVPEMVGTAGELRNGAEQLWNSGKYHLIALLSATSVIGVMAVPLLLVARGYFFSASAAAIYASYPAGGFMVGAVLLGITELITLPCLMVLATDAILVSRRLIGAVAGGARMTAPVPIAKHALVCALVITASAICESTLVPKLLSKFTSA